eukprot:GILK01003023.1.p1 GENE.GILK01003023.1~~GILK01003023.1.p1  ORF type:complete len:195 (-),score=29.63 GILK01003023.1:193-777(-)
MSLSSSGLLSLIVTSLATFVAGWYLGRRMTRPTLTNEQKSDKAAATNTDVNEATEDWVTDSDEDIDEDEDEDEDDGGEKIKLVLVVRQDLEMGKGKIAAQCSHATLGIYRELSKAKHPLLKRWEWSGQAKVVVKAPDGTTLMKLQEKASAMGVPSLITCDAGRTQVPEGSMTVLAVGPDLESRVNAITGHLKLM